MVTKHCIAWYKGDNLLITNNTRDLLIIFREGWCLLINCKLSLQLRCAYKSKGVFDIRGGVSWGAEQYMHIYSKNTPTADAHVVSQSLSRLICCCLGLCHGWCWNSKILLSWQTLYCWKLPHVSCRSGEISQGWAHILLSSSVAMMIAEQFIWISVKFINNHITRIHS